MNLGHYELSQDFLRSQELIEAMKKTEIKKK